MYHGFEFKLPFNISNSVLTNQFSRLGPFAPKRLDHELPVVVNPNVPNDVPGE